MSPTFPLSLILFFSCLCLFTEGKMTIGQQVEGQRNGKLKTTSEQEKKSETDNVRHRNKWWLIETTNNEEGETTNNEEGGEYGEDYQVPVVPCGKYLYTTAWNHDRHPCPTGTEITTDEECRKAVHTPPVTGYGYGGSRCKPNSDCFCNRPAVGPLWFLGPIPVAGNPLGWYNAICYKC